MRNIIRCVHESRVFINQKTEQMKQLWRPGEVFLRLVDDSSIPGGCLHISAVGHECGFSREPEGQPDPTCKCGSETSQRSKCIAKYGWCLVTCKLRHFHVYHHKLAPGDHFQFHLKGVLCETCCFFLEEL